MSTLGDLFPAGGGKTANFTADGAIAAGKPVLLNSDGTISEITSSSDSASLPLGSTTQIISSGGVSGAMRDCQVTADPFNHNRWVYVWVENASDGTDYTKCRFVTRSGNSLTLSSERTILSGGGNNDDRPGANICWCTHTANKFIIGHSMDTVGSLRGSCTVVTVSDSGTNPTLAMGTTLRWSTRQYGFEELFIPIAQTGRYLTLAYNSAETRPVAKIFTVTGTTIALSSTSDDLFPRNMYDSAVGLAINPWDPTKGVAIGVPSSGSGFYLRPFTLDGTTITMGNERQIYQVWPSTYYSAYGKPFVNYVADNKIYITIFLKETDVSGQSYWQKQHMRWMSAVGTAGDDGVDTDLDGAAGTWTAWTPDMESNYSPIATSSYTSMSPNTPKSVIGTYVANQGGSDYVRCLVGTVNTSNDTVSFGTDTQMDSSYETTNNDVFLTVAQSHGAGGYFLVGWKGTNDSGYVRLGKTGGTFSNYQDLVTGAGGHIGIAGSAISNGASGSVTLKGAIHTGGLSSLTIGADYYLQPNGTVATDSSIFKLGRALSATTIDLEYQS